MYCGPERRIHRVVVTKNTEYHMRRRTCVLVMDRKTGERLEGHDALLRRLTGALAVAEDEAKINTTDIPNPGEILFFDTGGSNLITSPVIEVIRPPKDIVQTYPNDAPMYN